MGYLVIGGSGSGKSAYAEALAAALHARRGGKKTGPLLYLATMDAPDEESRRRVARHRKMRRGKGFVTLERPLDLAGLELPPDATVLLEDLGNLAANELYAPGGGGPEAVSRGLEYLATVAALVAVGNEVFSDGEEYGPGTREYLDALAKAHSLLARLGFGVAEVVCGLPIWHRGKEEWMP